MKSVAPASVFALEMLTVMKYATKLSPSLIPEQYKPTATEAESQHPWPALLHCQECKWRLPLD